MLLRVRWFLMGVLSAVTGGVYLLGRLRKMRLRVNRRNLRRAGGHAAADVLGRAARAIAPDGREGAAG